MNNQKLCPMRSTSQGSQYCRGNDCAWWLPLHIYDDNGKRVDTGHCAVAELAWWARIGNRR